MTTIVPTLTEQGSCIRFHRDRPSFSVSLRPHPHKHRLHRLCFCTHEPVQEATVPVHELGVHHMATATGARIPKPWYSGIGTVLEMQH